MECVGGSRVDDGGNLILFAPARAPPPSPRCGPACGPGAPTSSPMRTFKRAVPPCACRVRIRRLFGMDRRRAARPVDVHRRPGKPAVACRTHGPPPAAVGQRLRRPAQGAQPRRGTLRRRAAGLPAPAVHAFFRRPPAAGRWLVKPIWGLGDSIHFWTAADVADRPSLLVYLQEYVEGESQSAVYCGDGKRAALLGVSRQLVGEDWLHAAPFRYCGSIGPLPVTPRAGRRWRSWVPRWPAAAACAACSAWTAWSATAAFIPSRSIRAIPHPLRCWNTPAACRRWPGIDRRSSHRPGRRPRPTRRPVASARPFTSPRVI